MVLESAPEYSKLLNGVLERLFPHSSDRANAKDILARYGKTPLEPEVERVCLAILKLADGDITRLESAVIAAKEDYEDTIWWAEQPKRTQFRIANRKLTGREETEVEAQDRKQYEDWLLGR